MNVLNDLYKPTYPIAYLSELYGSDIVIGRPGPVGRFLCTRHQVMMGGSLQLDDRRSHLSFAAELIDYVKRGQISCAATPKMVYVECRYADHATARVVCSTEDKGKMWASQASDLIKCMAIACMAIEYSEPVRKTFEEAFQLSDDLENALNAALLFCDTFKWEFVDQFPEFKEGKNIPEEDINNIWGKFYKVDKARTREYGGNGIGLSIVKAIMDSYGKEYGVRNLDNGVEFWFDLDAKSVV